VSYRRFSKTPLFVHLAAVFLMATILFPAALRAQVAGELSPAPSPILPAERFRKRKS
jgi:hypothetical protein